MSHKKSIPQKNRKRNNAVQNEWQNGETKQNNDINQETDSEIIKTADEPLTGNDGGKADDGREFESAPLAGNENGKAEEDEAEGAARRLNHRQKTRRLIFLHLNRNRSTSALSSA
jgi:hypothetical protein